MAVLPQRVQEILRECLRDPREEEERRRAEGFGTDLAWDGFASSQRAELKGQVRGIDEQMEELGRQAEFLRGDGESQTVQEVRLGSETLVRFPRPQTVESLLAGNGLVPLLAGVLSDAGDDGPLVLGRLLEKAPIQDVERLYYACLLFLGRQEHEREQAQRLEGLLAQMEELKERKRVLEEDLALLGKQDTEDGVNPNHREEAENGRNRQPGHPGGQARERSPGAADLRRKAPLHLPRGHQPPGRRAAGDGVAPGAGLGGPG